MVDNFARSEMGNIWLAKDAMIQREVAYKELLPRAMRRSSIVESSRRAKSIQRFLARWTPSR